jgi:hypothetical protein
MGEYRFGLHSGEVSEYLFGVHYGHLTAPADQIAGRHGAWHVNYTDPHGQRRGWFACPNRGAQFDQAIARERDRRAAAPRRRSFPSVQLDKAGRRGRSAPAMASRIFTG